MGKFSDYPGDPPDDFLNEPLCPDCGIEAVLSEGCYRCPDCGQSVEAHVSDREDGPWDDEPGPADPGEADPFAADVQTSEAACPHGNKAGDCPACDHAADLAFDAQRERGRR